MNLFRDRTVHIGGYALTGLWLAPMAGYTDIAFRTLAREHGAALTVTEMVSVRGLVHDSGRTAALTAVADTEKPSCVQLFGSDPDDFAQAARLIDCDIIDVNMGCPMPKIVKNGDGSALLDKPQTAGDIVRAIIDATGKPVTVKTRLGRRLGECTADKLIRSVASAGASAVTLHGRYAEQRYTGRSDVKLCADIAKNADIPIVYNGDYGTDGFCMGDSEAAAFSAVAVGRAAIDNIGIFDGTSPDPFDVAVRHIQLLTANFDDRYTVNQARKFFVRYFKNMRGGKAIRAAVNEASAPSEILEILDKARSLTNRM